MYTLRGAPEIVSLKDYSSQAAPGGRCVRRGGRRGVGRGHTRRNAAESANKASRGSGASARGQRTATAGQATLVWEDGTLFSPSRRGRGARQGAMQAESGIVPDFEVGEEFHEEPKIYYELKSQPLKHRCALPSCLLLLLLLLPPPSKNPRLLL